MIINFIAKLKAKNICKLMSAEYFNELMYLKLMDIDKFCFKECIKIPGKKLSVKEENCLSNYF